MSRGAIELTIRGVGLLGPGLDSWEASSAALRALHVGGTSAPASHNPQAPAAIPWSRRATVVPAPARLPANERRRAGTVIKAALAVADQAVAMADADPAHLATVFTSSTGDPANCHALCEALAAPERLVSPTRFTNSVHNAPAGYWHIATHSMCASTSIAAYDASFGAGLLEAAVICEASGRDVLLVACDVPYPEPLHALRPLSDTMAVALLLAPGRGGGSHAGIGAAPRRGAWRLRVEVLNEARGGAFVAAAAVTPCADAALEALRCEIPAARALPLLCALAAADAKAAMPVHLEAADGYLIAGTVEATP